MTRNIFNKKRPDLKISKRYETETAKNQFRMLKMRHIQYEQILVVCNLSRLNDLEKINRLIISSLYR